MTIIRITSLSQMNREMFLKETPSLTFKQFRQLARNPARRLYFFNRHSKTRKNLMFEERGRALEHQYNSDNVCQICGQPKPKEG